MIRPEDPQPPWPWVKSARNMSGMFKLDDELNFHCIISCDSYNWNVSMLDGCRFIDKKIPSAEMFEIATQWVEDSLESRVEEFSTVLANLRSAR